MYNSKKYSVTVKHDKGRKTISVYAPNYSGAVEMICNSELCPESAIEKVQQDYWYVTMTDRFMSGWGCAEGKINKLIVQCETRRQADIIRYNALKRSEMKYVNVVPFKIPYYDKSKYLLSIKRFDELGDVWTNDIGF